MMIRRRSRWLRAWAFTNRSRSSRHILSAVVDWERETDQEKKRPGRRNDLDEIIRLDRIGTHPWLLLRFGKRFLGVTAVIVKLSFFINSLKRDIFLLIQWYDWCQFKSRNSLSISKGVLPKDFDTSRTYSDNTGLDGNHANRVSSGLGPPFYNGKHASDPGCSTLQIAHLEIITERNSQRTPQEESGEDSQRICSHQITFWIHHLPERANLDGNPFTCFS